MSFPVKNVITEKRAHILESITTKLSSHAKKLDRIIEDLSKENVDDKAAAKSLLASAKKIRKALEAAA